MSKIGGIIAIIIGLILLFCVLGPFLIRLGFQLIGFAFNVVAILAVIIIIAGIFIYLKER